MCYVITYLAAPTPPTSGSGPLTLRAAIIVGQPPIDKPVAALRPKKLAREIVLGVASMASTRTSRDVRFHAQVVLHNPETGPHNNELKNVRWGTHAENNAERAAPTKKFGDAVKWRRAAEGRRRAGPWKIAPSRAEAGRQTGVDFDLPKNRRALKDGTSRLGKGGARYEFVDMSIPDDIDKFVEVRVRPELLQRKPHAVLKNLYIGRTFVDTKTKERFTVSDVFNNYDDDDDYSERYDHSLRLALWFCDAKKYKKTPAKDHWCYVEMMAADGYKWVDSSAPAAKKRKTSTRK